MNPVYIRGLVDGRRLLDWMHIDTYLDSRTQGELACCVYKFTYDALLKNVLIVHILRYLHKELCDGEVDEDAYGIEVWVQHSYQTNLLTLR